MKRCALHLVALLALLILCGGCASIVREEDDSGGGEMPWNTPAGWEGQGVGIPM